jgi:hypothetical protein
MAASEAVIVDAGGRDLRVSSADRVILPMTERSGGELQVEFHGGTLLTKEIDVMNGVKTGSVAIGTPSGAAATNLANACNSSAIFAPSYLSVPARTSVTG